MSNGLRFVSINLDKGASCEPPFLCALFLSC